jgi:hypothetical protein
MSNIDIDDGLVNGAVGTLKYIELDDDATVNESGVEGVVTFTTDRFW